MGQGSPEETQKEGKKETGCIDLGLSRDCRIRKRNDFIRVYQTGKRRSNRHFAVNYLLTGEVSTRLGLSVSKKLGGSVVRNRMKRRLRSMFRLNKSRLNPGYDIIINPRKGSDVLKYAELEESLLSVLGSARLLGKQ